MVSIFYLRGKLHKI